MTEREIVEVMARINGLFVGQLDADEMAAFERACDAGLASWSYEGAAGFLGLAKVKLLTASKENADG